MVCLLLAGQAYSRNSFPNAPLSLYFCASLPWLTSELPSGFYGFKEISLPDWPALRSKVLWVKHPSGFCLLARLYQAGPWQETDGTINRAARELSEDTVHVDWWGHGENHWSLASLGPTRVWGGGSITKVDIRFWKRNLGTQPPLHPSKQGRVMNALLSSLPSCLLVELLVDQSQFLVWGQKWCSPHMSVFRERV